MRGHALSVGRVEALDIEESTTKWSNVARIKVRYTPSSRGEQPRKLFLKMVQAEEFGRSEVDYFARDYIELPDAPIPRCYDTDYAEDPRRYHILMDDLSETHSGDYDRPPTLEYGLALADACAVLHSHWWGADRLSAGGRSLPDESTIATAEATAQDGYATLLAAIQEDSGERAARTTEALLARLPVALKERTADASSQTLLHGDLNPSNILRPRVGDTPVYFVDRQPFDHSLTVWTGASDLAYMMVLWWETDARRELEDSVLRRYHDSLVARGVRDYSWGQLTCDYALGAAQSIYIAAGGCAELDEPESMRWVWGRHARRVLAAVDDLNILGAI